MSADEQPFQHYTLKHRVVSWVSRNLFENYTYTVRHGLLRGMKRRGGLGWLPEWMAGSAETAELRFWRELPLDGLTVYDVGAFEGLLTMFFARSAGRVICFEPNSRNYARLLANLELNGLRNVSVRKTGVGSEPAKVRMVWEASMPGGATLDASAAARLQSDAQAVNGEEVVITTLDLDMAESALPPPDLIKIDIEGFELEALRGARGILESRHPSLYIEMHGDTMARKKENAAAVVGFLWEAGYRAIRHVESGGLVTPDTSNQAAEGHLYCKP